MPDFINILKQAQVEKDQALQQKNPGASTTQAPQQQQQPPQQVAEPPTDQAIANELFRQERHPMSELQEEPVSDNPLTWTPEYTQRGFVEEVGTSLMRGFGKHVVGGTGDIAALVNGIIPGWEIREGNMLSRGLQKLGKEFEEEYQVYMPDEIKDNEFTLATFMNPDFWSKTAAEYIPQLVEMILLSKGAGAAVKAGAKGAVKGLTKSMTKEALEELGQKAVVNASGRALAGASKTASEVAGQGAKGWRSLFMTSTGEATAGLATGAEMVGGGVGMNLLAGLQNAGGLMNEMKDLKGEDGELLYTEEQLADMAAGTMVENMKYLPIDMLSYGMVYAKSTGKFNKLLNPFNKAQSKKFFNQAEQLTATSKSFTREITPIMSALNKVGAKLEKAGKGVNRVGRAVGKPLFEGYEETFQETWEDWAKKKAVAEVTGGDITIDDGKSDGSLRDYFSFYMSKENEATRTIAMALGILGGAGSNIVEAVNRKAQQQYKNYSKTELFKHAATNEKAFQKQAGYIKQELIDHAIDGNVDSEAWINSLYENEVINEEMKEEWTEIAKEMKLDKSKADSMGNLNVIGQIAFLENKFQAKVAEMNYVTQETIKNDKIKALKQEFKNDPKKLKEELAKVEKSWDSAATGFKMQIALANKAVMNILSGEKADVSHIKHVTDADGNLVAVALSAEKYDNYYNKTDKEIYEDARKNRIDPRPVLKRFGDKIKEFYKGAEEKVGELTDKAIEKKDDILKKRDEMKEQKVEPIKAEDLESLPDEIPLGENKPINIAGIKGLEPEAQAVAIEAANELIKAHNNNLEIEFAKTTLKGEKAEGKEGKTYKSGESVEGDEETYTEEDLKAEELANLKDEGKAPTRKATDLDNAIERTFVKKDAKNMATAEAEMEKQIADAVKDLKLTTESEPEARKILKELVEKQEGRIGKVARIEGVTTEQFVDYLFKLGVQGAFKPETKAQKEKRKKGAKKATEVLKRLQEARAKRPESKNFKQVKQAKKYNNPNWNKEYAKVVKKDPTQKKVLQEEYDEYLDSTLAEVTLGENTITKQVALNQHLRNLYPDTKIQAYSMRNMYATVGEHALGYAVASSIMIDEKVWNQDDIFMHEFLHIHYELTKGEPATQAILKEALKNKELVINLKRIYKNQIVYAYKQKGWKPGMRKARAMRADFKPGSSDLQAFERQIADTIKLRKTDKRRYEARELPMEQQPVLLDELFAHYMQGPMSEEFSKFFVPRTDFKRQIVTKNWWKWAKKKAVENQDDIVDVLQTLNDGKTVPIDNLKAHIMGTFVSSIKGKSVNVRGRMKLSDEQTLIISDKNDDVANRVNEEFNNEITEEAIAAEEALVESVEAINPDQIGKVADDFDFWAIREPVQGREMFQTHEEILTEQNDGESMDLGTFWDKDFDATNIKNTELIRYFVQQYNKLANERRTNKLDKLIKEGKTKKQATDLMDSLLHDDAGELVDATFYEGLNLNKFTEKLMDIAKMYSSPYDFIRVLEDSKIREQQEFVKHLHGKDEDGKKLFHNPLSRLITMHLLYTNSEVLPGIIHFTDKNGKYQTKTPQASQDAVIVRRTKSRNDKASTEAKRDRTDAIYQITGSTRSTKYTQKALETILKFYGHDHSITEKVINGGRLIVNKRNQTLRLAIKGIIEQAGDQIQTRDELIIKAILNTGKKYGSTSVVVGPTGNNATTRMFSNHSIKLFNKMTTALKTSENTPEAKIEFVTEYANSKEPASAGLNPLLDAFWEGFHTTGELPLMVLDLGSENEMYNKSKNYKDASAEQQLLNEFLQFEESKQIEEVTTINKIKSRNGNKVFDTTQIEQPNYYASMDILGDSSRRILMSLPRINNLLNPDGTFNSNAEKHIAKMFKIYNRMSYSKKAFLEDAAQKVPANYEQFQKAIYTAATEWGKYLTDNSETLSKIDQFSGVFKVNKDGVVLPELSTQGEVLIKQFTLNRIANTFYVHEITSPGLLLDTITKLHKGQVAPVIALDENLKVEMIPMPNEYKVPRPLKKDFKSRAKIGYNKTAYERAVKKWERTAIITNDGIQYILEEHAQAIQRLNPDFNRGYKLYSHSIEKENPWFKNETSQMKGYTTILTLEEVTTGSQQHLKPIYDLLMARNDKFKNDFKEKYSQRDEKGNIIKEAIYDPNFRTQTIVDEQLPKYIPIIVPVTADKSLLFANNELKGLQENFTLAQLQDPQVMSNYQGLLDKIYYSQGSFAGLDGSNFGPQQIMDKPYDRATFSIQAITSIPFAQEGKALSDALQIQTYMSNQKWINLKTKVFDRLEEKGIEGDYGYSNFIAETANKLNSDPYTIRALLNGELPYSPHVAEFALNQFRAQMIRHGNNLTVPGTYGQTISDMGYKYTTDEGAEAFTNKPNRDKIFPKITEEYINGTSGLSFYASQVVNKIINGVPVATQTKPMEIILPKKQKGDKTIERQSFYSEKDGGRAKARAYLTAEIKRGSRKGQYREIVTLRRLNLVDSNDKIRDGAISDLLNENKIYSAPESIAENHIGTYIPGETIIMTRIPHNGPAFVGIAEVVGYHTTGASNIIVPAEYSTIIGADHDGDALFVYKQAKRANGQIDERMGDTYNKDNPNASAGYGNWNKAFDMIVDQWLSHNMLETLTTPLKFEEAMDTAIAEMDRNLDPKKYEEFDKLDALYDLNKINKKTYEDRMAKLKADQPFVMPFSPTHYKQQYNNSVIAKQAIGVAFNSHRALNMLATYKTQLSNGTRTNYDGTQVINHASITINGKTEKRFEDTPSPGNTGPNSRIHQSTILANIILDSTKNGHADAMKLNINSISSAMILVNLGFDISTIGYLLNHPMAIEYMNKRNDIGNDYIDSGSYNKIIYDYNQKYAKALSIYDNGARPTQDFNVNVQPLDANGKKNVYYESEGNNMAVIKLMHYLSKVSDDISTITDITSGHKKLENNPFALEKQINDLKNLLRNNKQDPYDKKNDSTLNFNDERSELNITESPEINHYIRVAEEYAKHQKKLHIANNESVRVIFKMIEKNVTSEELTGKQFKHFTDRVVPFIYSRLLGANNITDKEIREIFQTNSEPISEEGILGSTDTEPDIPLSQLLREFTNELDEIVHYEDPQNVLNKDTELSRSLVFKQGLIFDSKGIKLNPQVLQQHFSNENILAIKEEFSELPLKIQRQLVLYDLIEHGWHGEKSMYPIFPQNVTSFITQRAEEFQNKASASKFAKETVIKAYERIQDIETINPERNYLPNIYLDGPLSFDGKPEHKNKFELYEKLGSNKKVLDRIIGRIPFRVTVHSTVRGQRRSEVIQINPLGPYITKDDDINANAEAEAKANNNWGEIIRSLIESKSQKGIQIYSRGVNNTNLAEVNRSIDDNVHMVLIPDKSTRPKKPLPFMNDQLVQIDTYERKKAKKKSSGTVGRFFKSDYNNFTAYEHLTQEELIDAYEYKQTLTDRQEKQLWLSYRKDKTYANGEKDKWIDEDGALLDENPATGKTFTEAELIEGYENFGSRDAYATANITVPIMLELIQRESNYQTEVITKGLTQEGENDISLMKAWFQANNIDSSHPATQAMQREIETEFKGFMNERKIYLKRINDVTQALYAEKLNYNPLKQSFFNKVQRAVKLAFKNRDTIYQKLYGNIVRVGQHPKDPKKKRYELLSPEELNSKLSSGAISQAEYNFATTFREITTELDPTKNDEHYVGGGIPHVGPSRMEAFGRKGLLGVLVSSRPVNQGIYDVEMTFDHQQLTFKEIEDIFRQDLKNTFKHSREYIKLRNKANRLYKRKVNEDGSKYKHSKVFNHTLLSDGMVNNFANGGYVKEGDFLSMDLNRALSDFTHAQLFMTGNENFGGFKQLQSKVDGLLLHNKMKGFDNQNMFVRKVYKEYFLKAKKLNPDGKSDKVIDAIVRGNLLYIMGWKLLAVHGGLYVVGNAMIGKYNNIKNQGGASWLKGEKRFWGISQNGSRHRKAMGVLKNLNFMDVNFYDDVNLQKSSGLDSIFTEIALTPMIQSEKWIQGVHYLGLLTQEQWDSFDDNGNYKPGAKPISALDLTKIENTVKNSHGKGYTPTDQRMIQRYSWGRAMMQFSRFIPTMFYDKFSKEDINIYGEKHIGSLNAVWEMVAKFAGGEIPVSKLGDYRKSLDPEIRARFDSGLKGLAMVSVAIFAGQALNFGYAQELAGDANYLINKEKLEFKLFPSSARTVKDMVNVFLPF